MADVVPTKRTTLESPVARAIFRAVTYRWQVGTDLGRTVLADLGPNRHGRIHLQHVCAVMETLTRGGYLERMVADALVSTGSYWRPMIHYRLNRRPEA